MIGVAVVAAAPTAVAAVAAAAVVEIAVAAKSVAAAAIVAIAVMAVVAAAVVATEAAWKMVNGVAVSQVMCSVKFLWLPVKRPLSSRTPVATLSGQTGLDLRSRSDVC